MTSRERILKAAHKQPTDCVPVAPYIGNYGAALAGVPISKYNTNGKTMAEAQARAWEKHHLDVVVAQSDNYYIAQAFGVEIEQPENDTPFVTKTAISSLDEVDKLPQSIDVYKDGRIYVYLEAVQRLKEIFGSDVAIRSGGTGMFSLAGHMLGTQEFLTELALAEIDEDEEKHEKIALLMNRMTDALIAFSTAVVEAGSDFVVCGDSSASPDLISPAFYKKFVYPYEKRYFAEMEKVCQQHGAVRLLHICGNTTPILPLMCQTGADILEIDHKVDLATARSIVGDDICLMGNLDPVAVLMDGTPDEVARRSLEAIDKAGLHGAFILGSGCEVAQRTPLRNIIAMRNIARGHHYDTGAGVSHENGVSMVQGA